MATTYGEDLLRKAEARRRRRAARRRRVSLLVPATIATVWSLADLLAARYGRLSALDGGLLDHIVDHGEVVAWTLALVLLPLAISIKPRGQPLGAAVAFLLGPIASPIAFGSGGWHLWQSVAIAVICTLVLAGARARHVRAR